MEGKSYKQELHKTWTDECRNLNFWQYLKLLPYKTERLRANITNTNTRLSELILTLKQHNCKHEEVCENLVLEVLLENLLWILMSSSVNMSALIHEDVLNLS